MIKSPLLSKPMTLLASIAFLTLSQAKAATDIFMQVEGIVGESQAINRDGWIELQSFSIGVENSTTLGSGGITAGTPSPISLTIGKFVDRASAPLFLKCLQGAEIPTITIEFVKSGTQGGDPFYVITLSGASVTSITNDASGADTPLESVEIIYESIQIEHYVIGDDGTVNASPSSTTTWDFTTP